MKENMIELLSEKSKLEIDKWVAKYPVDQKQSAVMAALRIAQDANSGSLTTELMNEIAQYLEMPPIAVYEVSSFYSMYEHKPVGKFKISVCTNISCLLCGSDQVLEQLYSKIGIKPGETTSDGKYTIKEVECLGACVGAPMMQIGREYYEHLTADKIDEIIDQLD